MSKLLVETKASHEADLKDALHTFFVGVKELKPKPAVSAARRLQAKNYKVQFWHKKEWAAAATTNKPGDLFEDPNAVTPRISKAEYIVLKAIGDLAFPSRSAVEENRGYYNDGRRRPIVETARARRILWNAIAYIRTHKEE